MKLSYDSANASISRGDTALEGDTLDILDILEINNPLFSWDERMGERSAIEISNTPADFLTNSVWCLAVRGGEEGDSEC